MQFVDGTEWGDHKIGLSNVLLRRQPMLRVITKMVSAYSPEGERKLPGLSGGKQGGGAVAFVVVVRSLSVPFIGKPGRVRPKQIKWAIRAQDPSLERLSSEGIVRNRNE